MPHRGHEAKKGGAVLSCGHSSKRLVQMVSLVPDYQRGGKNQCD